MNITKDIFNKEKGGEDATKDPKKIEDQLEKLRNSRLKFEKRWFLSDRFADGNHFDVWKPSTREIGKVVFPKGMNVRPVHLAVRTLEGTLNNLLSSDPRWSVYPVNIASIKDDKTRQEKIEYAQKLSEYLQSIWDSDDVQADIEDMVYKGLKYCAGVVEGYWHDGRPAFRSWDTYDILFEPFVKDIADSRIIAKEVSVPLAEVKENTKYNNKKNALKPDNKLAGSKFKSNRLTEKHGSDSGLDKVLLREVWLRNPKGGWDLKHICQGKILFEAHYDWKRPPFISWALNPEALLQTSWFERLIPLNRAYDILLAQIEQYVRSVAVGRMMRKKGVGVERIMGVHGEMIDVDGPLDSINWLQIPDMGATPFNTLNLYHNLMSEIGAATASVGKPPKGIGKGFKLFESVRASEMSSVQHGVRRLERALEDMAEVAFMLINEFGEKPIEFKNGDESYEVVSSNFTKTFQSAIPVSDRDFGVNVKIESGLGLTEDGKRERAIELFKAGVIPGETLLENLSMGGETADIAKRGLDEFMKRKGGEAGGGSMLDSAEWKVLPEEMKAQILQFMEQVTSEGSK